MFPSELKAMREHYGLSQRSLAALLGWGEVTVHRYENGSLPDEAHNQLLHLLKYPENMLRIAQMNGERLPASARRKLFARLEELIGKDAKAAERTKSARTSKAALRGKNKKAKAPSHR
jgi:transcriptional regulator with XRE-family HTH domain